MVGITVQYARQLGAPGHVAPVVRQNADGDRELVTMRWGLVLHQKVGAPRRVTNVRQ